MAYHVVKGKGNGGFAKVYVVQDDHGNEFAQKVFAPREDILEAVGEVELKKRFRREVKYQQKIEHPNVVPVLDTALDEEPPYFIMPLAEATLYEELREDPSLGGNYMEVLFDILAGLERMHELGYVHRDLKPGNVLRFLDDDGRPYYAISDFGLLSVSDTNSSELTGANARGGTQNYAAPELNRDLKTATCAADIYSFGAILHDIFGNGTHRTPFSELNLPGALGEIVSKCTKRNPIRRYSSIAEVREELYRVLTENKIEFSSSDEEILSKLLKQNDALTEEQWDEIFIYLMDNEKNPKNFRNLFASLSIEHINHLHRDIPELFPALGRYFSSFIASLSFDFDYCDILASKGEIFYKFGDMSLKAKIALSLMELGVNHNRFYVERKFLQMVSPSITQNLADRIVTEIEIEEIDFHKYYSRLKNSIKCTEDDLHISLRALLEN